MKHLNRRQLIRAGAATAGAAALPAGTAAAADHSQRKPPHRRGRKPRIAAIATEYRPNAHADVVFSKLLEGYELHGNWHEPRVEIVSMYLDQIPQNDVGLYMADKHGIPVFDTIAEAMTVSSGGRVDVDGVILIGEHGTYPLNEYGQKTYPRRRFFDTAVAAMIASKRYVPVFNDKHLSQAFADAKHMYDTAQRYEIPMLAGSSLPLSWRFPTLTYPLGTNLDEAIAIGYSGIESYGFHILETLQAMVERRAGAETGVGSVQTLRGDAVWQAASDGRWDENLMQAALDAIRNSSDRIESGDIKDNVNEPIAFLIEYNDGFKATGLILNGGISTLAYAGNRSGDIEATEFLLEYGYPYGHFTMLDRQIESMMLSGVPPYPVERTLLTTGVLDAVMHSDHQGGAVVATPELSIDYQAVEPVEGTLETDGVGIGHELPEPSDPNDRPYPYP